jgi:hypothetical protein
VVQNYKTYLIENQAGEFVETMAVCEIDGKLLVAVPFGVWHRSVSKRLLYSQSLTKALVVEVGICPPDRRDVPEEEVVKLWMGFLSPLTRNSMQVAGDEDAPAYVFVDGDLIGFMPFADGLVAAAQEHFAFETGVETLDGPHAEPGSVPELGKRMADMEEKFGALDGKLESILQAIDGRSAKPPPEVRPGVLRTGTRYRGAAAVPKFPGLDQSVVAAALAAGVEEDALREMQRLLDSGKPRSSKLPEPKARAQQTAKAQILSESEDDAEEGFAGSGEAGEAGGEPLTVAVQKLTEIVGALTADKVKRGKTSKVEAALDGVSAAGLTETGTLGSGKKAAAARRALRSALQDSPEEIHGLIERAMLEDLTSQTVTPGQPGPQLCARAWLEHRSRIGHWKSEAHSAWMAAGALDMLIRGNTAGCRARLCLLLLMIDQTACDRGSWTLAAELALEQGPPLSVLAQHQPPAVGDGEQPFSRLLDPRWAEVALAHLRETDDYLTRRTKLGKKDAAEASEPKAKAKSKGKATSSTGKEAEA